MREAVYARLTVVCHLWPGITPWNVWDLEWGVWWAFADEADAWLEQRQKSST